MLGDVPVKHHTLKYQRRSHRVLDHFDVIQYDKHVLDLLAVRYAKFVFVTEVRSKNEERIQKLFTELVEVVHEMLLNYSLFRSWGVAISSKKSK